MPLRRQCAAVSVHHRLLEQDVTFRQRQRLLEQVTAQRLSTGPIQREGVTTIPVVVHVVSATPVDNIALTQIEQQLAVLNRDFRAQNTDTTHVPPVWHGLIADARIQFALATVDPSGAPTTGVTRTTTTRTSFGTGDTVKYGASGGHDAWPTARYLNIWVCTLASDLLGYAQFPGGPPDTDGVVILNTAFGMAGSTLAPFNLGRTTTHEVGHWLNLRHIWGDTEDCTGHDFVTDTPNAAGPNYGTPVFPSVSCQNGPSGDMFMNYMDYVDDAAMCMFTPQQVVRMQATLDDARAQLGT
jgi:Pregnancy-associated plasma protein-A